MIFFSGIFYLWSVNQSAEITYKSGIKRMWKEEKIDYSLTKKISIRSFHIDRFTFKKRAY